MARTGDYGDRDIQTGVSGGHRQVGPDGKTGVKTRVKGRVEG